MGQTIDSNIIRVCKICGEEFHPGARKQFCCGQPKIKICAVCGKPFTIICTTKGSKKITCSSSCAAKLIKQHRESTASKTTKICKWCGKEFTPKTVRDVYCYDTHYNTCVVCGKQFEVNVRRSDITQTCSDVCRYTLAKSNFDTEAMKLHLQNTMLSKYGVENAMYIPGTSDKIKATNRQKYGTDSYSATDEYKAKVKTTCQQKYGVDHHLSDASVKAKRAATCLQTYGAENVFASEYGKYQVKSSMQSKYGVTNPSQSKELKAKATKSASTSKLEFRICQLLDNYNIEYQHHYFLSADNVSHEFDFYLPEYKLLIDADGLYFHGYLDDPDGKRVLDYYDEIRLRLIPEDHVFHVIVEGTEEQQIKELVSIIEQFKGSLSSYRSYLFDWCRSIDFPYPEYSDARMMKDWKHLLSYQFSVYKPKCRLGESIIKNYHKSIYHCHLNNLISPYDGWYDDNKLMKVIRNRLIYKNEVEPAKILAGFNLSKICPCVSIFNPVLAKYLCEKYLPGFNTVFDPFSGFSGRLLGVTAAQKYYIGSDLNSIAVNEANQIINFLDLKAEVSCRDILSYPEQEHECLLTCPPYGKKEHYNKETVFKSCDEWIDECLLRFKCKRYVFVVDTTEKYKSCVVESIKSTSHFSNVEELVLVIDR